MRGVFLLIVFYCLGSMNCLSITSRSVSSRRQLLYGASASLVTAIGFPLVANADITNKVASSAALRNVKRSQKQLDTLELYVVNDDYLELMQAIRNPPLADLRKACTTLVHGGEDGPDADKLVHSYQSLIASLEKMYTTAGLGIKGRKLKEGELLAYYMDTVSALGNFVVVAEESVNIPVQYNDEKEIPSV